MDLITPGGGLLFWMVLIFAIVFVILAKAGFPVITRMVGKRNEHIAQSLGDAEAVEVRVAQIQKECDAMLQLTRGEQEKLLREARLSSDAIVEEAAKKAALKADEILKTARDEAEVIRREAIEESKAQIAVVAVAVAEKILREKLSEPSAQIALVEKIVSEIDEQRNNS